ncbi:hypothetical protein I315_02174 [Cryptococcus gattii Ru294]|nr:hypothetical protein I315_02174 [Cryptococcus gattii Ru294]
MLEWLEDVFDPYIRSLARRGRDPDSFFSMPLDVDFFTHLKHAYHQQLDDFQIGSGGQKLLKGMLYLWHQRSWAQVATPRQIRSVWRKSSLWPFNKQVMDVDPHTLSAQHAAEAPLTPYSLRILYANHCAVRQGKLIDAREDSGKNCSRESDSDE